MRLSKTALLAASILSSAFVSAADINYTPSIYDQNIVVNAGDRAILDASFSGAIGTLTGAGDFVKNGTGVLQYKGFQLGSDFYNRISVAYVAEGGAALTAPTTLAALGGLSGSVTVNAGELQVAGYLNLWKDWGVRVGGVAVSPVMEGVSGVRLNDTARLSFINTPLNVSAGASTLFTGTSNHDLTLTKRYNAVQNLTAGGLGGGAQTVLDTGADNTYRIIVHIDNGDLTAKDSVGSIGILAGQGDLIKTGADELKILGSSERGFGRVVVGNGQIRLADTNGAALATATSVNLVGSDGTRGGALAGDYKGNPGSSPPNDYWRPAFVQDKGTGLSAPSLVLDNSQTIRNLQADFAYAIAADPAVKTVANAIFQASVNGARDEAYVAGTGAGTFIDIGSHTLTLLQDRDAIYRGSIIGTGTVVANIAANHTLALILENGMDANLVIQGAGKFVANASGLGSGNVTVNGNLNLYQDNAGTLNAMLAGSGTVSLTASVILNNSLTGLDADHDMELNSNGNRGTLAIAKVQSGFTGTFRVLDGQTLELSAIANNALASAGAVTLEGGDPATGGRISTLSIADGVQTLKNLTGGANSEVRLGRGSLTLNSGTLAGKTTGVGNLIIAAPSGSTFALNGASATYFGATVVKSGTLGVVGSLTNSSGLILNSGATFNGASADQAFGALFGGAGSTVNMGSRTLTIGQSGARETLLNKQLAGSNILSTDYLGTQFSGTLAGSPITLANMGSLTDITALVGAAPATDPSGNFDYTTSGIAAATSRYLLNVAGLDQATAASLAFAGNITGAGARLVKVGSDRLVLTGNNTYTGATLVNAGILQANYNSLAGTSGVAVASGATFAINADAGTDGAFDRVITGTGALRKVGAGKASLTGDISGYTGALSVDAGTLQVNSAGALTGAVAINSGTTLILNQATDATTTGAVINAAGGTLTKSGAGVLTLADYTGTGSVRVEQGTLALNRFPTALDVSAGAVFRSAITGLNVTTTAVTGAGTVSLVGSGPGATLTAAAPNLFSTVTLDLRGVTLNLGGTSQQLGGFTGDAASSVALAGGTLVFAPDAGMNTVFSGLITGNGSIVKNGAGTTSFVSTDTSSPWTGTTTVNAGTLEATPESLGNSLVSVVGGTFALRNDNTAAAVNYGNATTIAAGATLAKTGQGEVVLTAGVSGYGGATIAVNAGRLTTADGGTDAVFTGVTVASGASYRVNMSGDRIHDSGTLVSVAGAGSLAVSGPHTLTLASTGGVAQSYTGNTELLNGANLAFGAGVTSVNGLAGDSTSTVTMPGDLTVNQSHSGTFSGQFVGGPGALTVTGTGVFGITGDLAAQAGISSVTVVGGTLGVDGVNSKGIVNNGTVNITVGSGGADRYTGVITGSGAVTKVGDGKLSFGDGVTTGVPGNPYVLQSTGTLTVAAGTLGGNFTTSGALVVAGGTLAPGNSPGTVTVNGDFTLASAGTLAVEINGTASDKVVVNGAASLAGALAVSQATLPTPPNPAGTPDPSKAVGGQQFTILTATGGVTGAFSNASPNGIVTLSATEQTNTGVKRVQLINTGTALEMRTIASIRDLNNFAPHDGIGGLISVLDAQFLAGTGPSALQALFDSQIGSAGFSGAVNNLSPLGYASEYAMAQDGENRRIALLHDRLEQRRYDRGSPLTTEDAPWEAFVVGSAAFADNKSDSDTPTFNYRTFGGMAGLDRKLNDELVVGAAVSYDNGNATIHDNGGKVDMNRAAGTLFMGGQLTKRWYFDLGLTGGYGSYESKRNTAAGTVKGDNGGFTGGVNAETGTIFILTKELHLTPYAGVAYTHHEYEGFTETGAPTALKLDAWSQDSLRAKVGTGLNWFVPMEWVKLKVGLDVAYAHELLDTDSEIDARFASGGPKFRTTAAAIPQDTITATPSLGFEFDDSTSATFSYGYEIGFDGRSYQSVNFAVRKRF